MATIKGTKQSENIRVINGKAVVVNEGVAKKNAPVKTSAGALISGIKNPHEELKRMYHKDIAKSTLQLKDFLVQKGFNHKIRMIDGTDFSSENDSTLPFGRKDKVYNIPKAFVNKPDFCLVEAVKSDSNDYSSAYTMGFMNPMDQISNMLINFSTNKDSFAFKIVNSFKPFKAFYDRMCNLHEANYEKALNETKSIVKRDDLINQIRDTGGDIFLSPEKKVELALKVL